MTMTGQVQPLIRVLPDDTRPDLREPDRPRPVRLHVREPARPLADPADPAVRFRGGEEAAGSLLRQPV